MFTYKRRRQTRFHHHTTATNYATLLLIQRSVGLRCTKTKNFNNKSGDFHSRSGDREILIIVYKIGRTPAKSGDLEAPISASERCQAYDLFNKYSQPAGDGGYERCESRWDRRMASPCREGRLPPAPSMGVRTSVPLVPERFPTVYSGRECRDDPGRPNT